MQNSKGSPMRKDTALVIAKHLALVREFYCMGKKEIH